MYIEKSAFIKAIARVDNACGTQRIQRAVELTLLCRLSDSDFIYTPSGRINHIFDARSQFHIDVGHIAELLEADGTLYCSRTRRFLDRDGRIANELIKFGISYATATKVKEARKLLRRSA